MQSVFLATLITYRRRIPLERLILFQLVTEVPSLFESYRSLTCLEKRVIGIHPEPDEYILIQYLIKTNFNIILPYTPSPPKWILPSRVLKTNCFFYQFQLSHSCYTCRSSHIRRFYSYNNAYLKRINYRDPH